MIDTGINFPLNSIVHMLTVEVLVGNPGDSSGVDGDSIDVGLLSTETGGLVGDDDGFIDGASLAFPGWPGEATTGAFLEMSGAYFDDGTDYRIWGAMITNTATTARSLVYSCLSNMLEDGTLQADPFGLIHYWFTRIR